MANIDYKDFKGIVTYYDENDLTPDTIQDSSNFKYEPGKAVVSIPKLRFMFENENYNTSPNTFIPWLSEEWEWETGEFCTIAYDKLSESNINQTFQFLVLIAKKVADSGWQRNVWIRRWDNGPDELWHNLFRGSGTEWDMVDITEDFLFTNIEGEAFIKVIDGKAKIYMPHDCFWIGHLDRDLKTPFNWSTQPFTGFYFDRLSEKVDMSYLSNDVVEDEVYYVGYNGTSPKICGNDRRIGIDITTSILEEDESGTGVNSKKFKFEFLREESLPEDKHPYMQTKYLVCRAITDEGIPILNPLSVSYQGGQTYEWYFPKQWDALGNFAVESDRYLIPKEIGDVILKKDSTGTTTVSWTNIHAVVENPIINFFSNRLNTPYNEFYRLTVANGELPESSSGSFSTIMFEDTYEYGTIKNSGYDQAVTKLYLVGSALLDETSEILCHYSIIDTSQVTKEKFGLAVAVDLPININKRITRVRLYAKSVLDEDGDFLEVAEYNLLGDDDPMFSNKILTPTSGSGVALSQRIAYAIDKDKITDYKLITGFKDVDEYQGVALGIVQGDSTAVYYSVLGGGNLQPDVLYYDNELDIITDTEFTAIQKLSRGFIVYSTDSARPIIVDTIGSALVFRLGDALEYGVKDRNKVTYSQGSNLILTRNGLFLSTGYEKKWLSSNINDQITNNYDNMRILYNPVQQEIILYTPEETIWYWLYSFRRDRWEKYMLYNDALAFIMIDNDGNTNFVTNDVGE